MISSVDYLMDFFCCESIGFIPSMYIVLSLKSCLRLISRSTDDYPESVIDWIYAQRVEEHENPGFGDFNGGPHLGLILDCSARVGAVFFFLVLSLSLQMLMLFCSTIQASNDGM
eukprot:TRINITY_DN1760_c0_g5_i2.p1 TRINITY_DN1760_c0_g5~~TRINITY_DN1760_c0_g5_i2.p1  ORF type:complete len:114 (-),score=19.09 TRINITY_DN1760_c0_g5_i2:22-363(-)